LKSLWTATKSR